MVCRPLQTSVKKLALVGPNVENIVTHDCGVRKEPSYLGCEGCYCKPPRYRWQMGWILLKMPAISLPAGANAIDPVSPVEGFGRHAAVDFVKGCSSILCDPEERSAPVRSIRAHSAAHGRARHTVLTMFALVVPGWVGGCSGRSGQGGRHRRYRWAGRDAGVRGPRSHERHRSWRPECVC